MDVALAALKRVKVGIGVGCIEETLDIMGARWERTHSVRGDSHSVTAEQLGATRRY